jgi:hypothetical protein
MARFGKSYSPHVRPNRLNGQAPRDQLNTASIDGQDLAERMFHRAPIMTRVFGE